MFVLNKKTMGFLLLIVFFVASDRFLKNFFYYSPKETSINLINSFLSLKLTRNENIAFSLPFGGKILITVIAIIIIFLLYYFIRLINKKKFTEAICLFAVILGAFSNLLDRIKHGFVIDYIDLKYFTVFNIADIMITLGIGCILAMMFKKEYQKQ